MDKRLEERILITTTMLAFLGVFSLSYYLATFPMRSIRTENKLQVAKQEGKRSGLEEQVSLAYLQERTGFPGLSIEKKGEGLTIDIGQRNDMGLFKRVRYHDEKIEITTPHCILYLDPNRRLEPDNDIYTLRYADKDGQIHDLVFVKPGEEGRLQSYLRPKLAKTLRVKQELEKIGMYHGFNVYETIFLWVPHVREDGIPLFMERDPFREFVLLRGKSEEQCRAFHERNREILDPVTVKIGEQSFLFYSDDIEEIRNAQEITDAIAATMPEYHDLDLCGIHPEKGYERFKKGGTFRDHLANMPLNKTTARLIRLCGPYTPLEELLNLEETDCDGAVKVRHAMFSSPDGIGFPSSPQTLFEPETSMWHSFLETYFSRQNAVVILDTMDPSVIVMGNSRKLLSLPFKEPHGRSVITSCPD